MHVWITRIVNQILTLCDSVERIAKATRCCTGHLSSCIQLAPEVITPKYYKQSKAAAQPDIRTDENRLVSAREAYAIHINESLKCKPRFNTAQL